MSLPLSHARSNTPAVRSPVFGAAVVSMAPLGVIFIFPSHGLTFQYHLRGELLTLLGSQPLLFNINKKSAADKFQRMRVNGRFQTHVIVLRPLDENGVVLSYFHFAIGPMTGPGF
jgi:hypothetical protein